jgi:hypothetical protein
LRWGAASVIDDFNDINAIERPGWLLKLANGEVEKWCLTPFLHALSAKTGIFGDLGHTFCTGHIAKGKQKKVGVVGFHHGRHVLGDGVIVFKILGRIKRDQLQRGLGLGPQSSPT